MFKIIPSFLSGSYLVESNGLYLKTVEPLSFTTDKMAAFLIPSKMEAQVIIGYIERKLK